MATPAPEQIDAALLELASAARPLAIGMPYASSQQRKRLADAVVRVLTIGRLRGLTDAPNPSRMVALETFKAAFALAVQAGVPRPEMVQLFNGDDGSEPPRKDWQ